MFKIFWSWPPVKVSHFRPFLSYMVNPWASGHISKCEGPRWAHSLLCRRVLRAIFDGRFAAFRCYVQNCWSWKGVTLDRGRGCENEHTKFSTKFSMKTFTIYACILEFTGIRQKPTKFLVHTSTAVC